MIWPQNLRLLLRRVKFKKWLRSSDLDPFFTSAPAGLVILDSSLHIVKANDTMAEMIGGDVSDILGKTPREVVPLLAPLVEPILSRVSSTGQPELNVPISGETPKLPGVVRHWIASIFPVRRKNRDWTIGAIAVEVTDQVQFDQLAKREALLAQAEEVADLGSWEYDCRANRYVWSPNMFRVLGRTPTGDTVPGEVFWALLHPDDRDNVRKIIEWAMRDRQPYEYRARIVLPDGRERHLMVCGKIAVDSENRVVKRYGFIQDITTRVEMERELVKSEERYRDLVENSRDLICTHDLDGTLLSLNDRPAQMLGYRREELIGRRIPDLLLQQHRDEFPDYIDQIQKFGHAEGLLRVVTREGVERIWEYQNTLRTEGVQTPVVRGAARDVTERVKAEKALRESENRLLALVESIDEVVFELDADGKCLNIWAQDEELLTRPKDGLLGRTMAEFVGEDVFSRAREIFRRVLQTGKSENIEYPSEIRGEKRWMLARVTPIRNPRGIPETLCFLARDITQRKRMEEELRRLSGSLINLQDEERRRIARDLHENTAQQLAALRMSLGRIKRSAANLPASTREAVDEAYQLAEEVINAVRTVSYVLYPPVLQEAGLQSAVRWFATGFAKRSGINITVDVCDDLGRLPAEHEISLFRILQECLSNIYQHAGARKVRIRLVQEGGRISMEVQDDGKGMKDWSNYSISSHSQVGVGIAGMRERVKQFDGTFEVDSAPEQGTTIRVSLPVTKYSDKRRYVRVEDQSEPSNPPH